MNFLRMELVLVGTVLNVNRVERNISIGHVNREKINILGGIMELVWMSIRDCMKGRMVYVRFVADQNLK